MLRLSQFAVLSVEEVALLEALCVNEERFAARVDIVAEGDAPRPAFVLTHGVPLSHPAERTTSDSDLSGPGRHQRSARVPDHDDRSFDQHIDAGRIATLQWEIAIGVAAEHPRLRAALGWSALQEDAIMRERMVSLGRRSARGRTAYLLWRTRVAAKGGRPQRGSRYPAAADAN
jgi:hypothetical protein